MNAFGMLDQLLDYSCRELQLSPTNHEAANTHYRAVGEWLSAEGSPLQRFDPVIYPQGSFRIGTTVYPIGRNEHDLDFVCEMKIDWNRTPAISALNAVEQRLRDHGTYAPMVERLKRCIRLNYSGAFHMDILPAAPESVRYGTEVRVPDRKLESWKPSNPKGYAEWFANRGRLIGDALLKEARIEPMAHPQSADGKNPLQRTVQLMKRARDRYFIRDVENAPRSIVLTTLAALSYAGQRSTAQAIHDILAALCREAAGNPFGIEVRNPANSNEVLSEQWQGNSAAYGAYRRWLQWFATEWTNLLKADGIHASEGHLDTLFGDEVVGAALRKHAADMEDLRKSGNLHVSRSGLLGVPTGIGTVRPNTFYGR